MMTPRGDQNLPPGEMNQLVAEIRVATRRLSPEQILDLADLLHETIRERKFEDRTWRRLHHDEESDSSRA
jgi:hypothetical protein